MICLRPDLLNTETVQYHHIIFQSVQFQINTDLQPTFSPVRIASEKYKLYSMCDCFCASTDLLFSLLDCITNFTACVIVFVHQHICYSHCITLPLVSVKRAHHAST